MKRFILVVLLVLGLAVSGMAMDVRVLWDHPDNNYDQVETYRIYLSDRSGEYGDPKVVDIPRDNTSHQFNIDDLADGVYYIVTSSFNGTNGVESGYSNEVSFRKLTLTPPAPTRVIIIYEP